MALPIPNTPTYETNLISNKKKVLYRPFLVKEEKALLIAEQSEDVGTMVATLKTVVNSCTFGKLGDNLPIFDLEYLLGQIRSKSVGEISELNIPCDACGAKTELKIDISKPDIITHPEHSTKIPLFDDVGVVMKYPEIEIINSLIKETDVEITFEAIIDCIDFIYDATSVHYAQDQTKEELTEFLDALTQEQFTKIESFFETMPKIEYNIDFVCPHCSHQVKRKIEGIHNFF